MNELGTKVLDMLKDIPYKLGLINEFTRYGYAIRKGGHCGFCGAWVPDEEFKVPKGFDSWWYTWGVCKKHYD